MCEYYPLFRLDINQGCRKGHLRLSAPSAVNHLCVLRVLSVRSVVSGQWSLSRITHHASRAPFQRFSVSAFQRVVCSQWSFGPRPRSKVGCWMLDVGCWMLAVGCWMFDVGCSMLDVGCSMLDVGCWMLDVGCSMLDVRCWMLDVGCWMFDVGCSMLDVRCWMFDVGCSMLDVGCWMLDVRCSGPWVPGTPRPSVPKSLSP